MNIQNELDNFLLESLFLPTMLRHDRIGSSLYHPLAVDVDFVIEVAHVEDWCIAAKLADWSYCSDNPWKHMHGWQAMRKDNLNIMVTADPKWYDATVLGSKVAQAVRLFNKEDRIRVMRVIREGFDPEDARDFKKVRGL